MPLWLLALAFAALVFYTDDNVIAGVLPEIAECLDVSIGAAGQLVTIFSITVALVAPVAAMYLSHANPRRVLVSAAVVFSTGNVLAALAPSFTVLVVARLASAVAAAVSTPSLFTLAARLSPPDKLGRYVAIVALGVTGALAVGVPVGTWISAIGSWRTTFAVIAALGVIGAFSLSIALPRSLRVDQPPSIREQIKALVAPPVSLALAANVALILGSMMMLTYLAPFMADAASVGVGSRGALFAASGVAGMFGIWAGGQATDSIGADKTLAIGIAVFIGTMLTLELLWLARPIPAIVLYPLVMIWGAAAFWNAPAVQARLHLLAGPASNQALALNTSGSYLGVAAGGVVGGVVMNSSGSGLLPIIAACAGLLALGLLRASLYYAAARVNRE